MAISLNNLRELAVRQNVKSVGSLLNFKEIVEGEYDPDTGTVAQTTNLYQFWVAVMNYPLRYSGSSLAEKLDIRVDDRKAYIAPNETTPTLQPRAGTWYVEWEGKWWLLFTVKPHATGGIPVMFEAQMRIS